MNLAQRSIRSSAYNIASSGLQTVILFLRSIILARLLDPEIFGIYTFAASFVLLTRALPRFGLGGAILHRVKESEGEGALQVHFTLSIFFGLIWFAALSIFSFYGVSGVARTALWVIAATEFVDLLTSTGQLNLVKRVEFRRIALVNLITAVTASLVAVFMAWRGFGVWSLVATDVIAAAVVLIGYYIYRPVWHPQLSLNRSIVKYFMSFGARTFLGELLFQALDRVDDLWTGYVLGNKQLGYYSRAYSFAIYPRRVLATSLTGVAAGTYAELKDQPHRLSQAFVRVNAFLIRTGFLFAGLLALIAPEFIRLVIGVKWLPMLTAFRLMLIFTLLDPIKNTIGSLFIAVGKPEKTILARAIQLAVLILGLFLLGSRWGIAGVALAVNLMLVVGMIILFMQARAHVKFSIRRMFFSPTLALISGMVLARGALIIPGVLGSPWRTGTVKTIVFGIIYISILSLLERDLFPMIKQMTESFIGSKRSR
jgi:O-antigen/teichoic acid export membrane protein